LSFLGRFSLVTLLRVDQKGRLRLGVRGRKGHDQDEQGREVVGGRNTQEAKERGHGVSGVRREGEMFPW
jgi:hypothetical protein